MVIIVAVLVGYLIVSLVTWLRWGFKVDIESMMAKAVVTPAVQRQRLGRAESVGIRVRDALPTKPEAPWTSTRVGKSDGCQRRATGPGVVPRIPTASSVRRGVSWNRNGR